MREGVLHPPGLGFECTAAGGDWPFLPGPPSSEGREGASLLVRGGAYRLTWVWSGLTGLKISQSLVVPRSSGGFHHSLAQVAPEETGYGDRDVLGEDIQVVAVSASPDPQGLGSEGVDASHYRLLG